MFISLMYPSLVSVSITYYFVLEFTASHAPQNKRPHSSLKAGYQMELVYSLGTSLCSIYGIDSGIEGNFLSSLMVQ